MKVYFEIGPLKGSDYTGIAQVTAALAEQFLGDPAVDSCFFFGRMMIPKRVVGDLLNRRNGDLLEWYLQKAAPIAVPHDVTPANVAIFPNRKSCRRGFAKECQIIHDFSTLLTPQFHHQDTIDYHATTLEHDIATNDLTFCVSKATRSDVLAYFPEIPAAKVQTLLLAASIDGSADYSKSEGVEPYILVLGTIEPRKNVHVVLQFIKEHVGFLKQHRFVFLGRFGWGATVDQLLEQYGLTELYKSGRLVFPGFVSEHVKNKLLANAEMLVYPSLFEGFGLPLLEAATLGVPCVTTRSSSLPEVGGEVCYYFDPFLTGDFDRTLMRAILDLQMRGDEIRRRCTDWAQTFSWGRTYRNMISGLGSLFPAGH